MARVVCYASKLRKATSSSDFFKSQGDERVFAVQNGTFVLTMNRSKHHVRSPKRSSYYLSSAAGNFLKSSILVQVDSIWSFLLFLDDRT